MNVAFAASIANIMLLLQSRKCRTYCIST